MNTKFYIVIAFIIIGSAVSYSQIVNDSTKTTLLDEVTIIGKTIKETPTGYKIQLGNKDIVKGKNAAETLGFLPNITVINGSILVNGQAPSKITIDGRKVRNAEELRNLPGDFLDNIEVKYVPDAGDITNFSGGTIAIRLKKLPTIGYYGSISGNLDAGIKAGPYREAISPVVSAKTGNLSIYDWLYAGLFHNKEWATQTFESATSSESFHELQRDKSNQLTNTLNLNYELNPRHSIALNWYYAFARNSTNDKDTDSGNTLLDTRSPSRQNTVSLIYTGQINNYGDRLNASLEWLNRNLEETMEYGDETLAKDFQSQTTNLMQFQTDYNRNIANNHSFSAGVTYLFTKAFTKTQNNTLGYSPEQVITQTPKVFALIQGDWGKLSYYAAIGFKHNSVKVFPQNAHTQNAVEPTVRLSIPIKKRHRIALQYSHTLEDIEYDAISERKRYINGFSYFIGNPDLKASSRHNASLSGVLMNNRLNLLVRFTRIGNPIEWETFTEEGTNINYTKPVNVKSRNNYSFIVDYTLKLFGWWTIKPFLRLSLNSENGTMGGIRYNKTQFRQNYMINNSFSFKKGWGGSALFDIEPTFHSFDRTFYTVYQLRCNAYKYFCHNTMMLSLDFVPVNKRRAYDRKSDQTLIRYKYTTPGQSFILRFTWFFRGGKKDINVKTQGTSLYYQESSDNF